MSKPHSTKTSAYQFFVAAMFCLVPWALDANVAKIVEDKEAGVVQIKDAKGKAVFSKKIKSVKKKARKLLQAELASKMNKVEAGKRLTFPTLLQEINVLEELSVIRSQGDSFALRTSKTFLDPEIKLHGGNIGDSETLGSYSELNVYGPSGKIVQSFVTDDQTPVISSQGNIVVISDEAEEASGGPNFSLISKGDIEKVVFSGPGDFYFSPNERFVLFFPLLGGDASLFDIISKNLTTIPAARMRGDFRAVPIFNVLDSGGVEMSIDGGTTMVKIRD